MAPSPYLKIYTFMHNLSFRRGLKSYETNYITYFVKSL